MCSVFESTYLLSNILSVITTEAKLSTWKHDFVIDAQNGN